MNLFSEVSKITMIVFLGTGLLSCSGNDEAGDVITPTNTIANFVAENEDYSSLAAALEITGLIARFGGSVNYTVFAPNNTAFNAFLSDHDFDSLDNVPEDMLREILLNHIQEGTLNSDSFSTGYIESMATGTASSEPLSLYINTNDDVIINGVSSLTTADIKVNNGVIHAVNAVIDLPDIIDFASADPNFDILVQALSRESDYEFKDILEITDEPAPFTFFAPTNDAFIDLFGELELAELADIDSEVLAALLSYHIATDINFRSTDLSDDLEVETYQGNYFTVHSDGDLSSFTDVNGRNATIISTDIQANNGVIHVLDTVLLPMMML